MGSDRIQGDNILWICFCCGCLPIIGIFKMIIAMPPCIIFETIPNTIGAIIMVPHDVFYTYYTVLVTKQYGPNLKIFAMLLLPAPLVAWPPLVCIGTLIWSMGYSIFQAQAYTFDSQYNLFCGGILEIWEDSFKHVKSFWEFNYNSYFDYLAKFREPLKDGEVPFDINVCQIIVGLFVCFTVILIDTPSIIVISLIWLIPMILKSFYFWFKLVTEVGPLYVVACFPFVIVGLGLAPVIAVLGCVGVMIASVFSGPAAAVSAYNDGIPKAYEEAFKWISEVWKFYVNIFTKD